MLVDQRGEAGPADLKRLPPQILPVELHQIERDEHRLCGAGAGPQSMKVAVTIWPPHNSLAVDGARADRQRA